jgi:hypothetical protein
MISSQKCLKVHLQKKNPCDKVCAICKRKFTNQRAYHAHAKTHIKTETPVVEQPLAYRTMPADQALIRAGMIAKGMLKDPSESGNVVLSQELFPLEDYIWEKIVLESEQTTSTTQGVLVHEKILYERTVIRAKNIEAKLKMNLMMKSLNILGKYSDIKDTMKILVDNIHAEPNEPHFHALCRTDETRDIISMYSRPHPDVDALWIKVPFKDSLSRLNTHAQRLTSFLLQAGINALTFRFWPRNSRLVLCLFSNDYQTLLFRENQELVHRQMPFIDKFEDITEEHREEAENLLQLLEQRKDKVMLKIQTKSLDAETWRQFFNRSRVICLPTVKRIQ